MAGTNVVPLRKKRFHPADIVERAILSGRRLPLQVMLDTMWRIEDEIERLGASADVEDAIIARSLSDRLFRIATEIAPYIHPKVSATIHSGDPGNPILHEHTERRRFERITDETARRYLAALEDGTMTIEEIDAELSDH